MGCLKALGVDRDRMFTAHFVNEKMKGPAGGAAAVRCTVVDD